MTTSLEIKKITIRRGAIKSELTRFLSYIDNFDEELGSYEQLQNRLETIHNSLDQFKLIQTQLDEAFLADSGEFDSSRSEKDREEFENKYHAEQTQ